MSGNSEKQNIFGINAHVPDVRKLDLIAAAGIRWVRVDFEWNNIEKQRGTYNWQAYRDLVRESQKRNLSLYGGLGGTPVWSGKTGEKNAPPQDIAAWTNFVTRAITEFAGQIEYWGLWNEPNLTEFWTGSNTEYRDKILIPGYKAAKAANPKCVVVGPEVSITAGNAWWTCITEICSQGGRDAFDIFSCHVYKDKGPELVLEVLEKGQRYADEMPAIPWPWIQSIWPKFKAVRKVMEENGILQKKLWLTEVGWSTGKGKGGCSEEKQASYYNSFCTSVMQQERVKWLDKVFFYELWDENATRENLWGLVTCDWREKQVYSTFKKFLTT